MDNGHYFGHCLKMPIAEMLNYKGNSDITKTARSAVFVINCKTQAPVGKQPRKLYLQGFRLLKTVISGH